jgi:hypothetical protein
MQQLDERVLDADCLPSLTSFETSLRMTRQTELPALIWFLLDSTMIKLH